MSVVIERVIDPATLRPGAGATFAPTVTPASPTLPRLAVVGLIGLRLAIGFEFLWAFFDKTFGFGYATPVARAWINGGSPTKGFLSGANGPLAGFYGNIAGSPIVDWLFMLGLLGVGVALILGVAVRAGALAGGAMLLLMYIAVWLPTTTAGGQPTGSTNPIVDDHIIAIFALVVIAALANVGGGYIGHRWAALRTVATRPWLR